MFAFAYGVEPVLLCKRVVTRFSLGDGGPWWLYGPSTGTENESVFSVGVSEFE